MQMLSDAGSVSASNSFSMGAFSEALNFQKDMTNKLYDSLDNNKSNASSASSLPSLSYEEGKGLTIDTKV